MPTLAESLIASSSRPLALKMRADLTASQQRYLGRTYWVVKEPVGLKYFRFQEEEYAILQMLDGDTSLDEIKDRFEEEYAPQKISYQNLQQFVGMLHRSGLVLAEVPDQGKQLKRRGDDKLNKEFLGSISNVLALRWIARARLSSCFISLRIVSFSLFRLWRKRIPTRPAAKINNTPETPIGCVRV